MGWFFTGGDDGPAFGCQASRPGHLPGIGMPKQKLAVGAVQNIEKAVAVSLNHQLARLPFPNSIDERWRSHGVIVMHIVRGELEMPLQLARRWIKRNHRVGVKIVALAIVAD